MGKLALFCGASPVAWGFASRMLKENPEKIGFIEFIDNNACVFASRATAAGVPVWNHSSEAFSAKRIKSLGVTTAVLLWWPKIVHIINKMDINVINTHPSYLPYNRGKHPYYWSIVDGTPFGATIHLVDDGVDTGPLLWRKQVELTPLDTGETAYKKGVQATTELLNDHYQEIVSERFPLPLEQNGEVASSHHSREFELPPIRPDELYDGYTLINDCRARTFDNNRSGRRIEIDGKIYRVHLKLVEEQ